jgi:putative phosphoesterase
MMICIVSDSHDNRRLLQTAVADSKRRGAEAVLHCGDIVAPSTLNVTQQFGLPVHVIHGNNTGDQFSLHRMAEKSGGQLSYYGQDAGIEMGGRKIFIVHYPHYAEAMATTGDWDMVCCGHDHKLRVQWIDNIKDGKTVLVNPGTVAGIAAPATYIIADLEKMEFEAIELDSADILDTGNA